MQEHINAQNGIKKIYISMVLLVIKEIIEIIAGCFEAGIVEFEIGLEVCEVAVDLLLIAAFAMQIAGLFQARKDMAGYNKAYIITMATLVFIIVYTILITIVSSNATVDTSITEKLAGIVAEILSIVVDYLTIKTTIELLEQNQYPDLADKGRKIWKTILTLFITAIVISVINGTIIGVTSELNMDTANLLTQFFEIIFDFVIGILNIIAYAKYRKFLEHAYPKL